MAASVLLTSYGSRRSIHKNGETNGQRFGATIWQHRSKAMQTWSTATAATLATCVKYGVSDAGQHAESDLTPVELQA
eukprot:361002-Chlamydomonas_euryale.AAC.1